MMGKCLWKMYNQHEIQGDPETATVGFMDVVDCFVRAIQTLPERKSDKQDPIFEPHYKLVSIVHKLVQKGDLEVRHILLRDSSICQTC